jgi:hypothetical protein
MTRVARGRATGRQLAVRASPGAAEHGDHARLRNAIAQAASRLPNGVLPCRRGPQPGSARYHDFERISRRTPLLADLKAGNFVATDLCVAARRDR